MKQLIQLSARWLRLVLIGLPIALYLLYLGLVSADRYVSESIVAVRQAGGEGASLPGAAMLLAGVNPPAREDTLYLKEFIHSRGLVLALQEQLDLRSHYATPKLDWPFRLAANASREDFVDYYRARVEVLFDDRSSLLKVRSQGFDAATAQRLNRAILDESERFVNETSHRIARERLRFAEGELQLASERLQKARNDLLAFQNKHRLLDPQANALSANALTSELEANKSRLEAELGSLRAFLFDDSYQVSALKSRIDALQRQIDEERRRATTGNSRGESGKESKSSKNDNSGARLNALAIDFQGLQMQAEFAKDAYKLALGAVENARIDATRKLKSLLVVEPPTLPETAEYPRIAYNLATLLAICVLLYAITKLVLATVREHLD
jgi:capsular polysaccharide transport system permease protein